MAKITPSVMLESASGKAGTVVFYRHRGTLCMRPRVITPNPRTPAQLAARARMYTAAKAWKDMDAETVAAWNTYAATLEGNPTGNTAFIALTTKWLQIHSPSSVSRPQDQECGKAHSETEEGGRGVAHRPTHPGSPVSRPQPHANGKAHSETEEGGRGVEHRPTHPGSPVSRPQDQECGKAHSETEEGGRRAEPRADRKNPEQPPHKPQTTSHKPQSFPLLPPAEPFSPPDAQVTAEAEDGAIVFTIQSTETSGSINPQSTSHNPQCAELLLQPLASPNRTPEPHRYASKAFATWTAADPQTTIHNLQSTIIRIPVPPGAYAPAYRFVDPDTGQSAPVLALPVCSAVP